MKTPHLAWIAASFACAALTGCRFGNHISTNENPDTLSGYYGTQPQSLRFCATHAPASNPSAPPSTDCQSVATGQAPSLIAKNLTNPTALVVRDLGTREAALTAYDGGKAYLPIWIGEDNSRIYYVNSFSPQGLWTDARCISRAHLYEDGQIVRGESLDVPGSSRKTSGRLSLKVRVTEVFEDAVPGSGACAAALQEMSACYQNVSSCPTSYPQDMQDLVRNIFEPYIQAGSMAASDIPSVANLSYEIQYE